MHDGSPLVTPEMRTRRHYCRLEHMSLDDCRFPLTTLFRRCFAAPWRRNATFMNGLTAHAATGRHPRIFHERKLWKGAHSSGENDYTCGDLSEVRR